MLPYFCALITCNLAIKVLIKQVMQYFVKLAACYVYNSVYVMF